MDRAGKKNQRIVIQKRTISYVKGIKQEDWHEDKPYYSCWVELLDLYGAEKYSAFNAKLENSIKFKCRSCKLLMDIIGNTKEFRVVWKSVPYSLIFADSCNGSKTDFILQVQKVS